MVLEDVDSALLSTVVKQLLSQDEALAASLKKVDLTEDQLNKLAQDHVTEIVRSATSEREQLEVAEAQLQKAEAEIPEEKHYDIPFAHRSTGLTVIVGAILTSIMIAVAFLAPVPEMVAGAAWVGAALLVISIPAIVVVQLVVQSRERASRKHVEQRRRGLAIDALSVRRDRAQDDYERALRERGLLPHVLAEREARTTPEFTTTLSFVTARGLSEVYDPAMYEVETPTVRALRTLLDQTPGGSIGLAGARGTGKSTAMASFVAGRSRRSDGKRGHSALVTAPVQYLPRDFILHLFATLCETVVVPNPPWDRPRAPSPERYLRRFAARGERFLMLGGLITGFAGVFLISWNLLNSNFDPDWQRIGGAALLLIGAFLSLLGWRNLQMARERVRFEDRLERERLQYERRAYAELKPREGVSEEIARAASNYLDVIRFQQTFTEGWSGSLKLGVGVVEGTGGLTGSTSYARTVLSLPEIASYFKDFVREVAPDGPVIIGIDELDKIESGERARAFLNDIKSVFGVEQCYFLVSVSEDALGSFQRRGLPVRDAFDSALDEVIRIPPLDLSTARVLIRNRVVGLPDPYIGLAFCLSGGLPREMIRTVRAIVMAKSKGITSLSKVSSSLLREDLTEKQAASMSVIASQDSAVSSDTLARLDSLSTEPEAKTLLRQCYEHLSVIRYFGSTTQGNSEVSAGSPPPPSSTIANKGSIPRDGATQVLVELLGYFYFSAAVLQVFRDDLDEVQFQKLSNGNANGTLDQLARARQTFALGPALAMAEVTQFCRANRFDFLPDTLLP